MTRAGLLRDRLSHARARTSEVLGRGPRTVDETGTTASVWRAAITRGLVIACVLLAVYVFLIAAPTDPDLRHDAYAYWSVEQPDVYSVAYRGLGAFPYSPPAALVADTFGLLPWEVFIWTWTAMLLVTATFISGGGLWLWVVFLLPFVVVELIVGNIHLLLGLAVVLGFRHPWTWTFVLLTKFTCGIGLLWFAVRREWRNLALATLPAVVICAVTAVLVPSLWADWLAYLVDSSGGSDVGGAIAIPLWPRLVAAGVLVTWGALTDRRWTVIVAATLALPVLWITGLAMLIALIALWRARGSSRPRSTSGRYSTDESAGEFGLSV